MRAWLIRAPGWVLGLTTGLFSGVGMTVVHVARGEASWPGTLMYGFIMGAVFGLVMGPILARMNRRFRETAGEEYVDRLSRIGWRGWRAKVGDDPELREAARRVTLLQRDQLLRQRRWAIPLFALLIGLTVWLAVVRSPWHLLPALVFTVFLVGHLALPRRLERRAEELRDPASGAS